MKRFLPIVVFVAASTVVFAAVRLNKGPVLVDVGTQLVVSGKISGLGNGDVTVIVDANGVALVECTNPGGNVSPGQNTNVAASGSATFPSPKNGNLNFSVTTAEPPAPPPTPTCPNDAWSAAIVDVVFSGGTLTVVQGGAVVLSQSF